MVFLGLTSTKQRIKGLAQGHNAVPWLRWVPKEMSEFENAVCCKF